jgi:very-short-patch-repair endonuclease
VHKAKHYRGGYDMAGLTNLARQLRKEQTSAEALLWQLLRNRQLMGFKFRRQHQFGDYVADFYCYEAQLVVECDGAVHERNERWQHDQARDAYLTGHGLRVLRFTNEQVLEDTEITLKEISSYLPVPMNRRSRGAEDT